MKNRRSTTPKPKRDELSIDDGRKARRKRFGLENNKHHSHGNSFLERCLWLVAIVVAVPLVNTLKNHIGLKHVKETVSSTESVQTKTEAKLIVPEISVPDIPVSTVPDIPVLTGGYGYPDKCTPEQMERLEFQFPIDRFGDRPWRDASFTIATARTKFAYNPLLMREFYASDDFKLNTKIHSFFGVIINWHNDDVPIDTLAIGSRDEKFKTKEWDTLLGLDENKALPPVAINSAAGTRPARVLAVTYEEDQSTKSLSSLKESLHISDDELEHTTIEKNEFMETISKHILSKVPVVNGEVALDQPIHSLHVSCIHNGCYGHLLKSLSPMLNRVRYLHFSYGKDGNKYPKNKELSAIIDDLKNEGLACYFAGKKEINYGLWRITDCFLDLYDQPHWGYIDCVSVKHDDVKELVNRMEKKFQETLKQDHTFRVPGNR